MSNVAGSTSSTSETQDTLRHPDRFVRRHIGPDPKEQQEMLATLGYKSLDELIDATVPKAIRLDRALRLPESKSEYNLLRELRVVAAKNKVFRNYIGMGYYGTITPAVIQRNILENPGWYTQYTPYQAEISQGRLESLLNFQTMVADLTALPIANASLLDEATAAAEAMHMAYSLKGTDDKNTFFISELCHPQTIEVVKTRALPLGIEIRIGDHRKSGDLVTCFGALVQYPATNGVIYDYRDFINSVHNDGAIAIMATDLLVLTLLVPPGELGADIAIGNSQRFGVPLGFGGPHAAFLSTKDEYKRAIPGRLIGVSKDASGRPGYRLSLQTREQHIRREKATSNICTAQALLANMAAMYAVYHGPAGLKAIAQRIQNFTAILAAGLKKLGHDCGAQPFFDTLTVRTKTSAREIVQRAAAQGINLRFIDGQTLGISLDETVWPQDVEQLLSIFGCDSNSAQSAIRNPQSAIPQSFLRTSAYLQHPVFNQHHSETELLRYMRMLESRDLSLAHSMIPLGSCTMKLNATAEMFPVSWPEFSAIHPFAPADQTAGYHELFKNLEDWLAEITGFAAISLQPNAGSQGEYAGLLAIYHYNASRGQSNRNVCLIPTSAHGTNPASAVMAGFTVVPVACDAQGNIDVPDLKSKAAEHAQNLGALMITYPSTHGVFEESIKEICAIVHQHGGQVYMDGANMNAQVGLCRPGDLGADVCHLNLHKTFCIPHGGGGPGVGPIGVAKHLVEFLPSTASARVSRASVGPVAAAPHGSASILPISWMYIALMGPDGLKEATEVAILNANYIAKRLENHFPVLYKGAHGRVAHECILDLRGFKTITVEDVAKRLMDYGFHAPTISWPVPGTVMIEPTESESKAELDRFCDAMISIHAEIKAVETGRADKTNNVLKNAPHTAEAVISDKWDRPYPREQAAYPAPWLRHHKFWPPVGRIDNVFGDRHLVCSCIGMEAYR